MSANRDDVKPIRTTLGQLVPDAPARKEIELDVLGSFDPASRRICIVGSRAASAEGIRRARKIAALLVRDGIAIVSGLARGVDTAAHRAAIETGGRTIAVIGTPIDTVYPPENREIQHVIVRDHVLVSEFPRGSRVERSNFAIRNLTMAIIGHGSIVVEANDGSGTLGHARAALRYKRPVWILKSCLAKQEKWVTDLLDHGAEVLSELDHVLCRIQGT